MPNYLQHKNNFNDPAIASVFDEVSFWCSRFGWLLADHLELRPNLRILDLGCATGFPLFELAHMHGPSCRLVGLDIWREALDRAASKLTTHDLPNVQLVEADGAKMPFPDAQFDLIVSNLGINNFDDPQAAIGECYRVAKPAARVVLTTNLSGHMQEFYEVFRASLISLGKDQYLPRLAASEAHRGTRESVCALLEGAGFEVTKVVEDIFQMRYLDGTALFNHALTKRGFLDGWRAVLEPQDEQEIFGAIEKRLNDLAAGSGGLRMTVPILYVEGRKPA